MSRSLPQPDGVTDAVDYGDRVKIALMDSGIGLLAAAAAVRRLRPDADLVLSSDPEGMPWGPRTPDDVTERALAVARAAVAHAPDALIVACNTASVHALPTLRAELEPAVPIIGTVPAIKPAAAGGGQVAIWATPATTGSVYQRRLINDFAGTAAVTEVPCPGLADGVQHADDTMIDRAITAAAALTPEVCGRSSSAAPTTNSWPSAFAQPSESRSSSTGQPRPSRRRRCAGWLVRMPAHRERPSAAGSPCSTAAGSPHCPCRP